MRSTVTTGLLAVVLLALAVGLWLAEAGLNFNKSDDSTEFCTSVREYEYMNAQAQSNDYWNAHIAGSANILGSEINEYQAKVRSANAVFIPLPPSDNRDAKRLHDLARDLQAARERQASNLHNSSSSGVSTAQEQGSAARREIDTYLPKVCS